MSNVISAYDMPLEWNLGHSIKRLYNSTISTNCTTNCGNDITFYINIGSGDPIGWGVYIYGKTDRGLGVGGSDPDYPYYVEDFHGSNTQTVHRTETADDYVAILALKGEGEVDFTYFTVGGGGGETHKECQGGTCVEVSGAGTDNCSIVGSACGFVETHNVCQNGTCVEVTGAGTDECNTIGASCGGGCQPPGGVQRKCQDSNTICVWNQVDCIYNCSECSTGECSDGNCVTPTSPTPCQPPGGVQRKCQDSNTVCVWNQSECKYNCSQCQNPPCTNGTCATPTSPTGTQPTGTQPTGTKPTGTKPISCGDDQFNMPGLGCQKKNTVYLAAAAFIGIMVLTKKKD